jgi:hypothetical protein
MERITRDVTKWLRMSQTRVRTADGLCASASRGCTRSLVGCVATDQKTCKIEQVIVRTLQETPGGERHWSSRGMAKPSGLGAHRHLQVTAALCSVVLVRGDTGVLPLVSGLADLIGCGESDESKGVELASKKPNTG